MRSKYFVAAILILSCSVLAGQVVLTPPVSVSGEGLGDVGAKIVLDAAGNPLVYWGQITTASNNLYTATHNGAGFNSPEQIDVGGGNPFVNAVEGPQLASSGNNAYIAFQYYGDHAAYLLSSTDGGESWSSAMQFSESGDQAVLVAVTAKPDGNPVAAYLQNEGGGQFSYQVVTSPDGGASWSTAADASQNSVSGIVCECCPASALASGDTTFLLFRNNNSDIRDSWIARSTDGAMTFPDAVDIDATDWFINGCPATGPDAILGNQKVTAAFMSAGNGSGRVYAVEIDRNSMVPTPELMLQDIPGVTQRYPYTAGKDDELAVVWEETAGTAPKRIKMAWTQTGVNDLPNHISVISDSTLWSKNPDITWDGTDYHIVYSAEGQVWYRKASLMTTTGISQSAPLDLVIAPNPVSSYLEISGFSGPAKINLYQLNGSIVKTWKNISSGAAVDLTSVDPGIYLIEVQNGEGIWNHRLLKH